MKLLKIFFIISVIFFAVSCVSNFNDTAKDELFLADGFVLLKLEQCNERGILNFKGVEIPVVLRFENVNKFINVSFGTDYSPLVRFRLKDTGDLETIKTFGDFPLSVAHEILIPAFRYSLGYLSKNEEYSIFYKDVSVEKLKMSDMEIVFKGKSILNSSLPEKIFVRGKNFTLELSILQAEFKK